MRGIGGNGTDWKLKDDSRMRSSDVASLCFIFSNNVVRFELYLSLWNAYEGPEGIGTPEWWFREDARSYESAEMVWHAGGYGTCMSQRTWAAIRVPVRKQLYLKLRSDVMLKKSVVALVMLKKWAWPVMLACLHISSSSQVLRIWVSSEEWGVR